MSKITAGWKSWARAAPARRERASVKAAPPSWIRILSVLPKACGHGKRAMPKCNWLRSLPGGRSALQAVADRLAQAGGGDRHHRDPHRTAGVQLAQHGEQVAGGLGEVAGGAEIAGGAGAGRR